MVWDRFDDTLAGVSARSTPRLFWAPDVPTSRASVRRTKRLTPARQGAEYRRIWRDVDGEIRAAFQDHPEYLAPDVNEATVRNSIVKRVVGRLVSSAAARRRVDPG